MTAGYRLPATAERALGEVLAYVAEQGGRERALAIHQDFVDAFEHLARWPDSGFTRPSLTGASVRWWKVHGWLVLYDATARPVLIIDVIHGARELGRILGGAH